MDSANMEQKLLAAALRRLEILQKREAFDPINPNSKPTSAQQQVIDDFGTVKQQWIRAGNQCFPEYSQVLMADGTSKPISKVLPGDKIMAFDYKLQTGVPATVLKRWENGSKDVYRYRFKRHEHIDATPNHKVVYHNGNCFNKRPIGVARELIVTPCISMGGPINCPKNGVELLGFLLGDGCLTKLGKHGLQITAMRAEIISHIKSLLPEEYHLRDCGNGDYFISRTNGYSGQNIYINWIREIGLSGKYAYNKFIPEVIFQATLEDRRKFIAGLIATDGYVNRRAVGFCSTSEQLCRDYLRLLRTVGLSGTISLGRRSKENHRPLWAVEIKNGKYLKKFHSTISVVSKPAPDHVKPYRGTLDNLWSTAKVRSVEFVGHMPVYDLTIDHPDHTYICEGVAVSNSGKSQTCSRLIAWALTNSHPTWTRPREWGEEPLLIIVAGRTGKQIEDSLLPKIRGYLEPGTYKEVRIGNQIQRLELNTGDRVVFQSLENPTTARERLQSYTAHIVWVDELPPTLDIVRELQVRVQARNGYFLASFTPTVVAVDIQKFVDALELPEGRVYRFNMLDNPLYSDPERRQQLINRYSYLSDEQRAMVFSGEWLSGDNLVYHFDYRKMVEMPEGYSPLWRHVESVDPAISSALGLTLWAENPNTGIWYCVLAEYIKGIQVPTDIVEAVRKMVAGRNIIRRTSDYAPWYTNTAAKAGIHYITVFKKNADRKPDLIKNLQQALGARIRISPTCDKLISEFQDCRWSERGEGKLMNSSSYHLLDSAQYFVDCMPKREERVSYQSQDDYLYQMNEKRKKEQAKKIAVAQQKKMRVARWR